MAEKIEVFRATNGTFASGQSGFEGQTKRIDIYLRHIFKDNLPGLCNKLMEMIFDESDRVRCSTKATLIKMAFEYAEGKPIQVVNVSSSSDSTPVEDLNRNEMRLRAESLDPAILELQEEMKQAEEYQAYIEAKKQEKEKPKKKEKVING